jgi:hypothetical protein
MNDWSLALLVMVLVVGGAGCPVDSESDDPLLPDTGPPDGRDGGEVMPGPDADRECREGGALGLGQSSASRASYTPYSDEGAEVRLVHGFQGGYHLEPAVYVPDGPDGEFESEVYYDVWRLSDGERLNRRRRYLVTHHGWLDYEGGLLHHSNPVILAVSSPEALVGDRVCLEVRVDIEGGREVSGTRIATVVDGGRP